MRHHYKGFRRAAALALGVLCLASLCAGPALAANGDENTGNEDIQLKFLNNSDGTDYTAQILTGNTIQVQMTLDDFSMPSSTAANQALLPSVDSGSASDVTTVVSGGGARGVYTLTPTSNNDNMLSPVTYVVTGNVNSITPPKSGYVGMVQSGATADDVGARLVTSQAISQRSVLVIYCEQGESPNHSEPSFKVTRATGAFAGFETDGKIGIVARESNLSSNTSGNPHYVSVNGEKRITFTLSQKVPGEDDEANGTDPGAGTAALADDDTSTELRTLKLSFVQTRQYDYIVDEDDATQYLQEVDGKWVAWQKKDDSDKPPVNRNNYITKGTYYTLTFDPPSSTNLYLRVASPKYVATKEILPDLAANNRTVVSGSSTSSYPYLGLEEGDTMQLVAQNKLTLITKDERWNDTFSIHWEWQADNPDGEADKDGKPSPTVQIPSTQNSQKVGEVTATINRKVDDVSGTLIATVKYHDAAFEEAKEKAKTDEDGKPVTDGNGDPVMETETVNVAQVPFRLTIRGAGIAASIEPLYQKWGLADSKEEYDPDKYGLKDTGMPAKIKMDVFAGGIEGYKTAPTGPYEYTLQLNMGLKNAKSYYAIASFVEPENGDGPRGEDIVDLYTPQSSVPYKAGTERIENPYAYADFVDTATGESLQGTSQLTIQAKAKGTATLVIRYYIMFNGAYTEEPNSTRTLVIEVDDTAPKKDATLSKLAVEADTRGSPAYDFGFDPAVTSYATPIELPFSYQDYIIRPVVNEPRAAENPIQVTATDTSGGEVKLFAGVDELGMAVMKNTTTVNSGGALKFSLAETSKVIQLSFKVTAHDPREDFQRTYTIFVRRAEPSPDDTLASLGVYALDDTDGKTNLITKFDREQKWYIVTVPYSTEKLRVSAQQNFSEAEVTYEPERKSLTPLGTKEYIELDDEKYPKLSHSDDWDEVPESGGVRLPSFHIRVRSEVDKSKGNAATGDYHIFINRLPPSEESRIKTLEIVDAADTAASPRALAYTPAFNMDNTGPYRMVDARALPYKVAAVRFRITPMDTLVSSIRIYKVDQDDSNKRTLVADITNPAVYSDAVELTAKSVDFGYNQFVIQLIAESGKGKNELASKDFTEYRLEIERSEASTDADLLDVALTGYEVSGQGGAAIKSFAFHRDETKYEISVPYEVRSVTFTPKLSDENATIQLRDDGNLIHTIGLGADNITAGGESKPYNLNDWGQPRTFDLAVTAQDETTAKAYTFVITREAPSTDALLKKLEVEGITDDGLSPLFKAKDEAYSATVAENAAGIYITPTANEKHAAIMVNGVAVASGQKSELIELLEEHVTVKIIVTAQDGTTQKTYSIDFFNQNLVEKTNNADLSSLRIERGLMTPAFRAAVTEYEVAVKEDTWSVTIHPEADDPLAEVKVFNDTRELGDYNGNYALALVDGENNVTVQVTSPDKTQTKSYTATIYRNQEDALKNLTPLTAEDIDYENSENPIIVSVTEYPRVSSDVFMELKNYPEKTIIFQGNDYSITFHAANLNTLIPTREIYDFSMSFSSPDMDLIKRYMGQWTENTDVASDVVAVYFDYHGDLPGPATLNLTLGNAYASQYLYWHYYNQERDRIDYYGAVHSNTQGSFSVAIDHFSTYLVTRTHSIVGADNRSGELARISAAMSSGKANPSTGAGEPEGAAPGGAEPRDAAPLPGAGALLPEAGPPDGKEPDGGEEPENAPSGAGNAMGDGA